MKSSEFGREVRVEAVEKRRLARWLNLTRLEGLPETAFLLNPTSTFHTGAPSAHSVFWTSVVELPGSWRVLRTPPADGAWNMACDLALMESARTDDVGIVRVYDWSVPTVSFGRHERTVGIYSAERLGELGLAAVRRPTGGRALLHSREVTYSVTMPITDTWRWTDAYDRMNALLLNAMLDLRIPARIVGRTVAPATGVVGQDFDAGANGEAQAAVVHDGRTAAPTPEQRAGEMRPIATPHDESHVCFSGIAAGEIAVGQRKLIASSVWRERGAYLQHGSILLHDDQSRLIPLLGKGASRPEPAAVLSEWLTPAQTDEAMVHQVESALHRSFRDCGNVVPWSIPEEVARDVRARAARLVDPAWLWRR